MDLQRFQNRVVEAMNYLRQGDYAKCELICNEIIQEAPIIPDAFSFRARAQLAKIQEIRGTGNRKLYMSKLMGQDISESLSDISFSSLRAITDLEKAIELAENAYSNYDKDILSNYYYYLAMAQVEIGTTYTRPINHDVLKKAIANLNTGIKYNKKDEYFQREIGQIYENHLDDFNSARKYFALAIEIKKHPLDYLFYSWCCYALGEIAQSEHYYKLGKNIDENVLNYGFTRWVLGMPESKQQLWKKFLDHCKSIN